MRALAQVHPQSTAWVVRVRRRRLPFAAAAVSAVLVAGCGGTTSSSSPATTVPAGSPTVAIQASPSAAAQRSDGWGTATPEMEGMDSATLADGLRQLAADHSQIHSLLIARHGNIVLDAYAYPYGGSTYHDLASVTKSITTTLIGIAADQGLLDPDATTFEFEVDEGPGIARYTVRLVVEGETARLDLIGVADEVVSVPGRIGGQ